jgi:hypothetical protein
VRVREQPLTAIGVGVASLVALCLTPAGLRTVTYYHGVLTNVAAERGEGLWAPLSLSAPADILLVLAAIVLAVKVRRARPHLWEVAVIAALSALTIQASRSGVWLMFFLVAPAARAIQPKRTWERLVPVAAVISMVGLVFEIGRGPLPSGASSALVARAVGMARGTPVLAADRLAEQVALAGGRIWVGNPIDAFSHRDQATYLDWLQGDRHGDRVLTYVQVVLVGRGSRAEALMDKTPGFTAVETDRRSALYARTH